MYTVMGKVHNYQLHVTYFFVTAAIIILNSAAEASWLLDMEEVHSSYRTPSSKEVVVIVGLTSFLSIQFDSNIMYVD